MYSRSSPSRLLGRLRTIEDEWLGEPPRLSPTCVQTKPGEWFLGTDRLFGQLLVSDEARFVAVVVWKVASRTLIQELRRRYAARLAPRGLTKVQRTYVKFVFVRSPESRLVGAYYSTLKFAGKPANRACVRSIANGHRWAWLQDFAVPGTGAVDDEVTRFKAFVVGVLEPPGIRFPGVQHVFSQSTFLSAVAPDGTPYIDSLDYVGLLDDFDAQSEALFDYLDSRRDGPRAFTPRKKRHRRPASRALLLRQSPSSMPQLNPTPRNLTAHLVDYIAADPRVRRLFCAFYAQDYACFSLGSLPAYCRQQRDIPTYRRGYRA
ncbi:hypothetical protein CTAYLR_005499 [Chrysophaeum taylorii]|uniref:Sulfotransferase family protein n=1 Tax=Chrysophaeum taylorii TaxID=2483200 RepID=A0AAD7U543_9STRA|nr:hypothetical protein CTAYLR_005499 [Chrysophaeum taylorii]